MIIIKDYDITWYTMSTHISHGNPTVFEDDNECMYLE